MSDIPAGIEASPRALRLLSRAQRMRVLRDSLSSAAWLWVAEDLRKRFERGPAVAMGYSVSQRRDAWAARRNLPETYDERKQALQGHDLPLVWTGRLRQLIYEQVNVTATAVRGTEDQVRGRIAYGRLNVGSAAGGWRQLPAGHPARKLLSTMTPDEQQRLAQRYRDAVVAYIDGIAAPQRRPPPAPPMLGERRVLAARMRLDALGRARDARSEIRTFVGARRSRLSATWQAWREQSGGSAPVAGYSPRPESERRAAHNSASRLSYYRRRTQVLARRRSRYRVLSRLRASR